MKTTLPLLLAASSLVCALAACAQRTPPEFEVSTAAEPAGPPEAPGASLAGTWELNVRETRAGMRVPGVGMPMGGGPGMGGRGGRPGAGGQPPGGMPGAGGAGGRPGAGTPGEPGNADDVLRGAPGRLVVTQTDSSITFTPAGGSAYTLFFDGRSVWVQGAMRDVEDELSCRWTRGRFEVRRWISNRRAIVETYELARNGARLVVRTRLPATEAGMQAREIPRVYDRMAAPTGSGQDDKRQ